MLLRREVYLTAALLAASVYVVLRQTGVDAPLAAGAAVLTMGAQAAPQTTTSPAVPMAPSTRAQPYLGAAGLPDTLKILPPGPQKGDIRYETDRKMFLATRKLAGTPRFALALNDDNLSAQALMKDMFARQGLVPHVSVEADESASPHSLVRSGLGLALLREDMALPASERDEVVIWPHTRVAALLSFIYPKTAEHDPATTAAVSQLRVVWGLS